MSMKMANRRRQMGVLILVAALGGLARAEIIDRVLAIVGGGVIMQSDVTMSFELGLVTVEQTDDPIAAVLSRLIDRYVILAEVDRYAPAEPTPEAIDRAAQQVRETFATARAFDAALARSGIDQARLRQTLRDELRIRAYLDQRFTVPPPTDDEIETYYRNHLGDFTRGGQVVPVDAARAEIATALVATRRTTLIDDWVNGLRRRADVSNLYLTRR
jgi:parvulin-like peptidyl-prolyl isomerase